MPRRILIVDDDPSFRRLLSELLADTCQLAVAGSAEEALEKTQLFTPDLALVDVSMPGMDGHELCRRLRSTWFGEQMQIVVVSGQSSPEEQSRAFSAGADDYVVKPINPLEFRSRVNLHFRLTDAVHSPATRESSAPRLSDAQANEIIATQDVAVFTLARVAESRDQETGEHLVRMRAYCRILAEELSRAGPYASRIDRDFLDQLYRSSPLHDIGKVGISDEILLKPGLLSTDEFERIKQHTVIGANILDQAVLRLPGGSFLAMAAMIARFHHEKYDGSGYPAGLVGQEIPLPARIVAVADVFDALTSARPYKEPYGPLVAKEMIEIEAGRHFDPAIVEALTRCFEKLLAVREENNDPLPTAVGAASFAEYGVADLL
jgi:putative two-component system response regulator